MVKIWMDELFLQPADCSCVTALKNNNSIHCRLNYENTAHL